MRNRVLIHFLRLLALLLGVFLLPTSIVLACVWAVLAVILLLLFLALEACGYDVESCAENIPTCEIMLSFFMMPCIALVKLADRLERNGGLFDPYSVKDDAQRR